MLDLAIIGSGPAALTAAIYAVRAGLKTTVFEKNRFGGTLPDIADLANFPGFQGPGATLAQKLHDQAIAQGAKLEYGTCTNIRPLTIDGATVETKNILVATGSEPLPLNVPTKSPISYCALCDGPLYQNKNIVVVGGGNSAVSGAIHLAKIVKQLTLISRSPLRADTAFVEELKSLKNITIRENFPATTEFLDNFDGVFVFIGHRPATTFLPPEILDEKGYIITDHHHRTFIPHLLAAGDVRSGTIKQVITAAADGAAAIVNLINH